MRSYEAARSLFSFMAFCAWSVVVLGVLAALIGASSVSQYGGPEAGILAMAPGVVLGITGLLLVAFVQMGRATVDTAEYTQQMLKVSRDQLEVSRQGLKQGGEQSGSFAALRKVEPPTKIAVQNSGTSFAEVSAKPTSPVEMIADEIITYRKNQIERFGGQFQLGTKVFQSLDIAKQYVESHAPSKAEQQRMQLAGQSPKQVNTNQVQALHSEPAFTRKREVIERDGKYAFGDMTFPTREAANEYAAQMGINPNLKT